MRRKGLTAAAAVVVGVLVGADGTVWGQEAQPLGASGTKFLAEAIRDGRAEVELGKAAAQKASSPEVKQFAERMVSDHGTANQQLMQLAEKFKVEEGGTYGTPPLQPDEQVAAKLRELSGMSGAQFDQAYMRDMVEDHQKAVDLYKGLIEEGRNEEVLSFARLTLPLLEAHLEEARSLADRVGATR